MSGVTSAALFSFASIFAPIGEASETLRVRVSDAIGLPEGEVAVVLRTYAPRGIGQGQICVRGGKGRLRQPMFAAGVVEDPAAPLAVGGARVFSGTGDGTVSVVPDPSPGGLFVVSFDSPSGTINELEGPMVVVFLRVGEELEPGHTLLLEIDSANSFLRDENGTPIQIEPRDGDLTIRVPEDGFTLEAEGDRIFAGEVAELGVQTSEPLALSGGQVGIRFDPSVVGGAPLVRMDERHGQSAFQVDQGTEGLIIVTFQSADGSLNRVPGELIGIELPTSAEAGAGEHSVFLDPSLTFLVDVNGDRIELNLQDDEIELQ